MRHIEFTSKYIIENSKEYTVQTQFGIQKWYLNDELHRELGPAWIDSNGEGVYYYRDCYVPVDTQAEYERWLKLKAFR